ncbi:MAG: alpha/beta fold hydrolase [Phycisphaerales bacterium]
MSTHLATNPTTTSPEIAPAMQPASLTLWPVDPAERNGGAIHAKVIDILPPRATGLARVVFLHGLVGLNDHWEEVVRLVRDRVPCTLFELPLLELRGEHCSIEGVARLTERFLREHVGGPAVLVGNSFGGHVALRMAIERPDLVRGLVLAGSSGLIEASIVADVQIRPSRAWLERKIGELFFDQSKMRQSDVDRAHAELSERGSARAMVRLSRSARRDVLRDRVGNIAVPTLLIWGRQDVVTPPDAAERFHTLIRGSRLEWFDGCGHVPMIEHPGPFASALVDFVRGLSERPDKGDHRVAG